MKINSETQKIEIIYKIFVDDFEIALKAYSDDNSLDLLKQYNEDKIQKLVSDYIKKNMLLKAGNKATNYKFLGLEIDGYVMFCYFETDVVKNVNSVEVKNTMLFETFADQINVIHINHLDVTKSLRLNEKDKSGIIDFKSLKK